MENKAVYQNYQNCNWGSRSTCTFELSTKIQFWKLYNIFKKKKKKKTSTKGGKHIYNQLLRTSFSHKMTSSFPQHTWNGILYPKSDFKVPGIDLLWCSPLLHILCGHLKVTTTPICNPTMWKWHTLHPTDSFIYWSGEQNSDLVQFTGYLSQKCKIKDVNGLGHLDPQAWPIWEQVQA